MNLRQVVVIDSSETLHVNEKLRVAGGVTVADEIAELLGFVGNMVDRDIRAQIVVRRDAFDIRPLAPGRVHGLVGQRRKTTVGVGRVERQNVYAADRIPEMALQHGVQVRQVLTQSIGVTNQLNRVSQSHHRSPVHR